MNYTFMTDILGPSCEVVGRFEEGQDVPPEQPTFDIESITVTGFHLDIDVLTTRVQADIELAAFAALKKECTP
jgi:hypothetical protein